MFSIEQLVASNSQTYFLKLTGREVNSAKPTVPWITLPAIIQIILERQSR